MKRYPLLLIMLLLTASVFSQFTNDYDQLMKERDSIYRLYKNHRDTLTVNTWLNVMKLNKYLTRLASIDSLIRNSGDVSRMQPDSAVPELQKQIKKMGQNVLLKESQIQSRNRKIDQQRQLIFYGFSLAGLLILLFLFLWLIYLRKHLKNKKGTDLVKNLQTKLYFAHQKLERYQEKERNLDVEKDSVKSQYDNELASLRKKIESLEEEKLMLENQIIEVKKAWEMEVQKRMDAQAEDDSKSSRSKKADKRQARLIADQKKEIEELKKRIEMAYQQLEQVENQLREEQSTKEETEKIHAEISKDLEICQQKKSEPDNELKSELDQLKATKEKLAAELSESRKSYENEVKTRIEIEKELGSLLERLKNRYF